MSNEFTEGQTVYNADGEMALYVSTAKGGGYIVQPLIEDGDGVTEPECQYADGVAIWPRVYKAAPRPMLDAEIAEQQARLAMLRGEIRALERQKYEFEAENRGMKERFQLHSQLTWIDDLMTGRFTHYLVKESDYSDFWNVKTAEDFRKDRNHSQVRLKLWVSVHERGESFTWKLSPCSSGDRYEDKEYTFLPFKSEAEAIAKRNEFWLAVLAERMKDHANAGPSRLREVVARLTNAGVQVPAAALENLRERELRDAQEAAEKARAAAAAAEHRLAALNL